MLELNKIHNMDCLEGLNQIKKESVALVFSDPPYNLLGLDKFVGMSGYINWSKAYIEKIKNILKWTGTFILCGRPPVLCYLTKDILDMGFVFRDWITWHKLDSITHVDKYHSNNYECFAIFSKWIDSTFNYIPIKSKTNNYSKERNIGSIWNHCKISSQHKEGTKHPNQKPIEFLRRFVQTYTNENDIVLDPFVGSGTTAVACKELNRKFIGFEINEGYIEMANKRLINIPDRLDSFNKVNDSLNTLIQ